ncbi:hypothetical protein JVU11DRAFT_8571 [Chiua virens]|nr:hypothetical protein JVU11DRAFT_8571 [Chiua virens]
MDDDEQTHQQEDWLNNRKNRLPSFTEVLSRRTRPPVDLFMFYLFLQREGAEDILDFWLDVQQHENLCRAYFKDVRKSGRTIKEDWPQYWDYARRRGSIYGTVVGLQPSAGKRSTMGMGDMLSDPEKQTLVATVDEKRSGGRSTSPNPRMSGVDKERIASASPPAEYDPPRSTTPFSLSGRTPTLFNLRRASRAPTIIPRSAAITRMDLVASAERIYLRYLSPAGTVGVPENHEIYLPPALRVHSFPLSSTQEPKSQSELNMLAHIPDMFHCAKGILSPRNGARRVSSLPPSEGLRQLDSPILSSTPRVGVADTLDWVGDRVFSYLSRCTTKIQAVLPFPPLHICNPFPNFTPIRT